ncbi:UDP-Glycosyltransferase/glycogen phosphorylase [Podospora aff. communis PSN243]|uniref:UDP-Glycosyltransferase/glycogen phosphorylase n=1 Tax=Podospora aff. communis PSN243 TaxID=3040156 RepID=A0AAV9GGC8_9PEZI|nr:UDP-Glycosyltransferase/glycogen phosphorylase [Podospora aff. communis PSN243]
MPQSHPLPSLLFVSHPLTGHLTPTLRVAAALSHDNFPIFFLGPTTQKARISAAGRDITFLPLLGSADFDDLAYYSPDTSNPPTPDYFSLSWQQRGLIDLEKTWIDTIPDEWRSVVAALKEVKAREPGRRVIVVAEALFFGIMPMFYGAELPEGIERLRTLALSVTVPFIRSVDVPAFFVGDDGSGGGWKRWEECTMTLKGRMEEKLREAGAVLEGGLEGAFMSGQNYTCHDAVLQLGAPGWFYPRSDWPGNFKFVGVLPPAEEPIAGWPNLPIWWDEVKGASQKGKKVVVVAQGTVEVDPNDLILPTLRAMAGRTSDVLVIAILGRKGATLAGAFPLPENARVADYLHYDAVLPYANAWVHNGGYGAVQHGVAHGVPMVVAGEGMDKVENANRIHRCGVGVNLGQPGPSVEDVKKAVDSVLDVERYRRAAASLRKESLELTCFRTVRSHVLRLGERP